MDVTPGAVSDAERNSILSRATLPESVRSRHDPDDQRSHLLQFTIRQPEGSPQLVYGLDRLEGSAQPYQAYA